MFFSISGSTGTLESFCFSGISSCSLVRHTNTGGRDTGGQRAESAVYLASVGHFLRLRDKCGQEANLLAMGKSGFGFYLKTNTYFTFKDKARLWRWCISSRAHIPQNEAREARLHCSCGRTHSTRVSECARCETPAGDGVTVTERGHQQVWTLAFLTGMSMQAFAFLPWEPEKNLMLLLNFHIAIKSCAASRVKLQLFS